MNESTGHLGVRITVAENGYLVEPGSGSEKDAPTPPHDLAVFETLPGLHKWLIENLATPPNLKPNA